MRALRAHYFPPLQLNIGVNRMADSSADAIAPLTTRTRVALAIARALAAGYGHENVTPDHMLLGLLREGENPAVAVLAHAGVSLTDLRNVLEHALAPRGPLVSRDLVVPLTDGERRLLARADYERRHRDDHPLGTEHVLLALLQDRESSVSQLLANHGLTYEAASAHIAAVVHYHAKPHVPSTG